MPTAILVCGSTGAGETTYSRELAHQNGGVVFSIDEWMKNLFWMDAPKGGDLNWALERVQRCEDQIWRVALQLLSTGHPVVLDLGFSKKDQRDRFKLRVSAAGHRSELHFLDIAAEVRRERVRERNRTKTETYEFEVDDATFEWMESYFETPGSPELSDSAVVILDSQTKPIHK